MNRDKLIEKIKSLLALASCDSTTEHERELALKRAQSLMLKYCISISDAGADSPEMQITETILKYQPRGILKNDNLFISLVSQIAHHFGVYTYRKSSEPSKLIMMGFPTNLTIAEYVIESLMTQGWSDYRKNIPEGDKNAGSCLNFWKGFYDGLRTKFASLSNEKGIELYDKVKDVFMNKITGFIKYNHGSSSSGGFSEGRSSAISSQIRTAVSSKQTDPKRIG